MYNVKECALSLSAVCYRATTMRNVNKLTTRVCPAHNQHQTTLLAMLKTHRQIRRGVQQNWDNNARELIEDSNHFEKKCTLYISCDDPCHETSMDSSGMRTAPFSGHWGGGGGFSVDLHKDPLDRDPTPRPPPVEGKWDQEQRPTEGAWDLAE